MTPGNENAGFKFLGTGRDYARVWFVDILCNFISLGLFAPWARVRKLRYFCSQFHLQGNSFAFDGQGSRIFMGRIVLGLILASWFLVSRYPWVAVLLVLLMMSAPYLLVLRYRYYFSHFSYGARRFSFSAGLVESYRLYLGAVLFVILTLFSGVPVFWYWHRRFVLSHTRWGEDQFVVDGRFTEFLGGYWPAALAALSASVGWVALVYGVGPERIEPYRVWPWLLLYALPFYFLFLFCMASVNARVGNFFWNHTRVGERRFEAAFETRDLLGLYIQNSFFLFITGGLYWPWAQVALWKYRSEKVRLI